MSFTIDVVPPTASISASSYALNTWNVSRAQSNTLTLTGSWEPRDFTYALDDADPEFVTTGPSSAGERPAIGGSASVDWNPTDGLHRVTVVAVDQAGNHGPPTTAWLGVGGPGYVAPASDTQSTRLFAVQFAAPASSGFSFATLEWRYANSGSWNSAMAVTDSGGGPVWITGVHTVANGMATSAGPLYWNAASEVDPATGAPIKAPALMRLPRVLFVFFGIPSCLAPRRVQFVEASGGAESPQADLARRPYRSPRDKCTSQRATPSIRPLAWHGSSTTSVRPL